MARVNWLGTHNNPEDVSMVESYLKMWFEKTNAEYVNGQLEKGKEGTPHIQFFLNYKKPGKRLAALKKHDPKAHFEPVGVDNGASDYCLKTDTRLAGPWEFGIKPARKNVKGSTAERNKKILELGPEKCVDEGLIPMREYLKVKQCVNAYRLNTTVPVNHDDVKGLWFWGPAGTGKSSKARDLHPDAFIKS